MKFNQGLLITTAFIFLATQPSAYAETPQEKHARLKAKVDAACPFRSQDVMQAIDNNGGSVAGLWGDPAGSLSATQDEQNFIDQYTVDNNVTSGSPSEFELNEILGSVEGINFECNAHRLVFLQYLLEANSEDSTESLAVAGSVLEAVDFGGNRWQPGDVRVTARPAPAHGWVFLVGQTIGSQSSNAQLKGPQYQALFEMAKAWDPANAAKSWDANHTVKLPDMRGRSIFANNNMNQPQVTEVASATLPEANQVGKVIGQKNVALSVNQMPRHTHSMNALGQHNHSASSGGVHKHSIYNSPSHSHSMGYAGTHKHNSKQALYGAGNYGWGWFSDKWPTGGIRSTRDGGNSATLTNAIHSAGNHKHSLGSGGVHNHGMGNSASHSHSISTASSHQHTNSIAGGTTPVNITPPGMVFNVEMKL